MSLSFKLNPVKTATFAGVWAVVIVITGPVALPVACLVTTPIKAMFLFVAFTMMVAFVVLHLVLRDLSAKLRQR